MGMAHTQTAPRKTSTSKRRPAPKRHPLTTPTYMATAVIGYVAFVQHHATTWPLVTATAAVFGIGA